MEKKVIDIMGGMDETLYFEARLSEDEEESLTRRLDFERVKKRAMNGIHCNSGAGRKRSAVLRGSRRLLKLGVCAAAAVMLLGGTVAVAQHLDAFRLLLGSETVLTDDEITDIKKGVSADGVRMTIDSVIPGENDFVTLVTFQLENGEQFSEDTCIYGVEVSTEDGFLGATQTTRLSDDRKQLITCIETSSDRSMLGKNVKGVAKGIYTEESKDDELDCSLIDCFKAQPVYYKSTEDGSDETSLQTDSSKFEVQLAKQREAFPVTVPQSKRFPGVEFAGVAFVDGKLNLVTYFPDPRESDIKSRLRSEAVVNKLVDSRTGEIYSGSYSSGQSCLYKEKGMDIAKFPNLKEGDLPYLKPMITYVNRTIIAEGPWEASFKVEDQGINVAADVNVTVNTNDGTILLKKVNISMVGGYVIGEWVAGDKGGLPQGYHTSFQARTKDGETLKFKNSGGESFFDKQGKECFKFRYDLCGDEGRENRIFLSREKLKNINKIILDGKEITVD